MEDSLPSLLKEYSHPYPHPGVLWVARRICHAPTVAFATSPLGYAPAKLIMTRLMGTTVLVSEVTVDIRRQLSWCALGPFNALPMVSFFSVENAAMSVATIAVSAHILMQTCPFSQSQTPHPHTTTTTHRHTYNPSHPSFLFWSLPSIVFILIAIQ